MASTFHIKTAVGSEVDLAVEWAAKEGWNPGLYDAECYLAGDPKGFLVGYLGDEAIATISAIQYGENFGFIGFYIVKEEYRDQGYGIQIWNAALERLVGRNIGLDGVVAQQENYKKSGFKLAYRNIRYEGKTRTDVEPVGQVVALSDLDFESIDNFDKPFFPENRSEFIKAWITQPESVALGMVNADKLEGYGVIRRCRSGYKIGPLFADSDAIAEALYWALQSRVEANEPLFLDVPEVNAAAVSLAERHNMKVVFETARMYTRKTPNMPLDKIFGVTSFEVG